MDVSSLLNPVGGEPGKVEKKKAGTEFLVSVPGKDGIKDVGVSRADPNGKASPGNLINPSSGPSQHNFRVKGYKH